MSIFNNWITYVALYIIIAVIFNNSYKVATKSSKMHGPLTIVIQIIAGISVLALCPLFEFKLPTNIWVYVFLGLVAIFYAITDRVNTTVRSNIEASKFSIINQIYTVFMILFGITLFKEPVVFTKMLGAFLIIFSNILVFYKKGKFKINKYVVLAILANLSLATAMFLDINISKNFNLAIYVSATFLIPAIILFIFERTKISDIKKEFKEGNKKAILITAFSWALMVIFGLKAYQLGQVTIVAPLVAISVILNVLTGYIFLNERDNLVKKIIAAILIIISVVLIKL